MNKKKKNSQQNKKKKKKEYKKKNKTHRQIKDRQSGEIMEGQSKPPYKQSYKNKMGDIFLLEQNQCHSAGIKKSFLAIPFI